MVLSKLTPRTAAALAAAGLMALTMLAAPAPAATHKHHHHHHHHGGGGGGGGGGGPFPCSTTPDPVARTAGNAIKVQVSCTGMPQSQRVIVASPSLQNSCSNVKADGFRIPTGFGANKNGDLTLPITANGCHVGTFNFEISEQSTPFKTAEVPVTIT
jgi:hypothetical protein